MNKKYILCVYIPEAYTDEVKQAIFKLGAGDCQYYSQCCWQVKGVGQFKPEPGSHAMIGEVGSLERVIEDKIEVLVDGAILKDVINELKRTHPYDVPAFHFWPVLTSLDAMADEV
jgi:hypothetical protein